MKKYYSILIRFCWIPLITASFAVCAVYFYYAQYVPKQYEATTALYISKDSVDAKENRVLTYNDLLFAELAATDSRSIIASRALLTKVADNMQLPLEVIRNGLSTRGGGSARIIVVASAGTDPERAKDIVEGVVSAFLNESEEYLPGVLYKRLDDVLLSSVKNGMPIQMAGAAVLGVCFSAGCILLISAIRPMQTKTKSKRRK